MSKTEAIQLAVELARKTGLAQSVFTTGTGHYVDTYRPHDETLIGFACVIRPLV